MECCRHSVGKQHGTIVHFLHLQQAPVILLKEGTDTSQGKPQIISNINACEIVVDAISSTLGPRGMDKLIVDGHGERANLHSCIFMRTVPPQARLPSPMMGQLS